MNGLSALIVVAVLLGTVWLGAGVAGQESLFGVVIPYAGSVIPAGWTVADGRLLTIASNPSLHAVLGTRYGGDTSLAAVGGSFLPLQ